MATTGTVNVKFLYKWCFHKSYWKFKKPNGKPFLQIVNVTENMSQFGKYEKKR